MLNTQAGLGLSQMLHTPPPSSPPPINNNDPRQQEFERFFHSEKPWDGDVQLRNVYFKNFNLIHDSDQVHRRTHTYNRYLNSEETTLNEAMEHAIEQVYRRQIHSFKINLSFSAIFQNRETQEYKSYYASNNTKLLDKPKLIQNQDDLNNLLNFLSAKDFPTHLRNQRPNTKWVLERIVNLQIRVFPTTYPLGNPPEFPDYIKNNRYIFGFETDLNDANRYKDHLCFFRCLAIGTFGKTYLTVTARLKNCSIYTVSISKSNHMILKVSNWKIYIPWKISMKYEFKRGWKCRDTLSISNLVPNQNLHECIRTPSFVYHRPHDVR